MMIYFIEMIYQIKRVGRRHIITIGASFRRLSAREIPRLKFTTMTRNAGHNDTRYASSFDAAAHFLLPGFLDRAQVNTSMVSAWRRKFIFERPTVPPTRRWIYIDFRLRHYDWCSSSLAHFYSFTAYRALQMRRAPSGASTRAAAAASAFDIAG